MVARKSFGHLAHFKWNDPIAIGSLDITEFYIHSLLQNISDDTVLEFFREFSDFSHTLLWVSTRLS